MDFVDPYIRVIAVCLILIISYLFNQIARKTNIPSVLLLIGLGVGIKFALDYYQLTTSNLLGDALELLGIVGLIMIVLEAALDLELTKEKRPMIIKSLFIALVALGGTSVAIAFLLQYFLIPDFFDAMLYAVPLSIMSSAIIIPSVAGLVPLKKEFMIYEATFSDILGIMLFYFLLEHADSSSAGAIVLNVSINIIATFIIAVFVSYALVLLFQNLDTQVKLFLLISVLILLYSIGKKYGMSSLVIILVFGLVLNNHKLFFKGFLSKWIKEGALKEVIGNFHTVTMESAFVVRTFFFVIFGMTLELNSLLNVNTLLISLGIIMILYVIRFISFKIFNLKQILPELFIAPRGLITILLFFNIPVMYQQTSFDSGILLYTILISSLVMTVALITGKEETGHVEKLNFDSWESLDREIEEIEERKQKKTL